MAWTAPAQATTGQVVTSAFWNAQIPDNFDAVFPDAVTTVDWLPTLEATTTNPQGGAGSPIVGVGEEWVVGAIQYGWVRWVLGGDPGSGAYFVTLPSPATGITAHVNPGSGTPIGGWSARDESTGVGGLGGTVVLATSTTARFLRVDAAPAVAVSDASPWVWASGDVLSAYFACPISS